MINVNYKGRFGNNLFQMSVASILAQKFGQNILNPLKIIISFDNCFSSDEYDSTIIINDENILNILSSDFLNSNIVLDGFFQMKNLIPKFIEYNQYISTFHETSDNTFIHIRLGDIRNQFSLGYDYYEKALSFVDNKKVIISSDSPDDYIVQNLAQKFSAKILNTNPIDTMLFAASCNNKILSHGTFSWWIGFLGNVIYGNKIEKTICPSYNRISKKWHGDIFPIFDWVVL